MLHQQGRVTLDSDLSEQALLGLAWQGQAGRDIIGASVCAVPAATPDAFRVVSARVVDGDVHVMLDPGRAWIDGLLTQLPGLAPDPSQPVERRAAYLGPPVTDPLPLADQIGDGVRDAVIVEVSEEALHAFQYPERLIEPALGGPDTAERTYVNVAIRLLRLGQGEDCSTITGKLRDDPAGKGKLTVSLTPVVSIAGDCPVVGGGGYSGFEHLLYRIEIGTATANGAARFKWSQWNGGLVGRGRFDATSTPARVMIDAGRPAIVSADLTDFYLEALAYDPLLGGWQVIYAASATLNTDHDLELGPTDVGTLPSTTDPIFFRLWNGIGAIGDFTDAADPVELRDGIRLAFDAPDAGIYRPGDYWTFKVRAGEISNPAVLIDAEPPAGIILHRAALAEIDWTGRHDTSISGTIEDCRHRFHPLTTGTGCCTISVGDGITSFGDFNALEEAANHLPARGGTLCLLPGVHRANLDLTGRRDILIHGCARRSLLLPREQTRTQPILRFADCSGIEVRDLDLVTLDGIAIAAIGSTDGASRDMRLHELRVIARTNAIRAENVAEMAIERCLLHLLDTVDGQATISLAADDVRIERNTLLMLPFREPPPGNGGDGTPQTPTDPADPCVDTILLYRDFTRLRLLAFAAWSVSFVSLLPAQLYRARGGIHVRGGSERVWITLNRIAGGFGDGITLGGDIDPPAPPPVILLERAAPVSAASLTVEVPSSGRYLAQLRDAQGAPVSGVDVYLAGAGSFTDRSDANGLVGIKAPAGRYAIDVAPPYQVEQAGAAGAAARFAIVIVGPRAVAPSRQRFLHQIRIEDNDISTMGLSGIGFATHGVVSAGTNTTIGTVSNTSSALAPSLLAALDTAILNLALTPLLRATDIVRELLIRGNRITGNLLAAFDDELAKDAQSIGRGGISLAIVDDAVIQDNHILDNGGAASEPTCGVFVGYGEGLELQGNVIAGNGTAGDAVGRRTVTGLRGGIYVRFAGALTAKLSASTGRVAALRVHDNRVDQPAGRALTAYVFGPVSIADNHLNSELTGGTAALDTIVGGVLLLNLGGIHRLLARRFGAFLGTSQQTTTGRSVFATTAEQTLPGGETLFGDNYVRLGLDHRSITCQLLVAADDLGYADNTASVFRPDPFFANAIVVGDTVRATASRMREDVTRTLSLLSVGLRLNMTALNQADHCIVALPAAGANPVPTVNVPNQVLDAAVCAKLFSEPADVTRFLLAVLAAARQGEANDAGRMVSATDLAATLQRSTGQALAAMTETQVTTTALYQTEAARIAAKRGEDDPLAAALRARAMAGATISRTLSTSAEVVTAPVVDRPADGAAITVRVVDDRGLGLERLTVDLVRANGTQVELFGSTGANGYVSATFDAKRTAALQQEQSLFLRATTATGVLLVLGNEALQITAGADLSTTLVVPLGTIRDPGDDDNDNGGGDSGGDTPPKPTPTPTPTPAVRTPLDRLQLDDDTKKKLGTIGVTDVEGIVESDPKRLTDALGDAAAAKRLLALAQRLLAAQAPAPPVTKTTTPATKADAAPFATKTEAKPAANKADAPNANDDLSSKTKPRGKK